MLDGLDEVGVPSRRVTWPFDVASESNHCFPGNPKTSATVWMEGRAKDDENDDVAWWRRGSRCRGGALPRCCGAAATGAVPGCVIGGFTGTLGTTQIIKALQGAFRIPWGKMVWHPQCLYWWNIWYNHVVYWCARLHALGVPFHTGATQPTILHNAAPRCHIATHTPPHNGPLSPKRRRDTASQSASSGYWNK